MNGKLRSFIIELDTNFEFEMLFLILTLANCNASLLFRNQGDANLTLKLVTKAEATFCLDAF